MKHIFSLIVLLLGGCAAAEQKLSPVVLYQKDIGLEINGEKFVGVGVPRLASEYQIKIKAKGKIDLLTITSCHREEKFEEPSSGWFSSGKSFTYTYKPVVGIEDQRDCLLDIGASEKIGGRHSWGAIDFQTSSERLPATISCNGSHTSPIGTSICQARAGLRQKIVFKEPVIVIPDTEVCSVMSAADRMEFSFIMAPGECTYYFGTREGKYHKLTTFGYESILIRGGD
ncbi:hypothetical protein Bb109J_c1943 [Bdellovibrio bacteriovorus]|uniref:hypothetical protein n=1 Tax=Bdellovibrio bacteriovorus TaxID=959 RepID=UPI00045BE5D2|nr:hypothetical protein [Bdellovibrio bacteriovorus]AHZ84633.1 hypothetical protein EP01_06740 [Bdellovibrio bacteriovorus]BEV68523.1 hypothetical protein Bb109J_c1943 [Bdellovibrio bacteriovorus]